jgi:hypothetical protein
VLCWCWADSCHFSLGIGSAQVLRDAECWLLHSNPGPAPTGGSAKLQTAPILTFSGSQIDSFLAQARWTLLAAKVCFPPLNVVSKLSEVRLRTGQAVLSTVDDSLTRVYWQSISGSWRSSASALDEEGKKPSSRGEARESQYEWGHCSAVFESVLVRNGKKGEERGTNTRGDSDVK